jgi:SAM-dependent methyltransferase
MGRELLIGCGSQRDKRLHPPGRPAQWEDLMTLDWNSAHHPDVVHDLEVLPYPFDGDTFDEIHAYEVLEHIGQLGDFRAFLAQFSEFWRILKPGGFFAATCPSYRSMWAFGDPSHKRVITSGTLVFLSQKQYRSQVDGDPGPKTSMSDFRFCYSADFEPVREPMYGRPIVVEDDENLRFILQAVKCGA